MKEPADVDGILLIVGALLLAAGVAMGEVRFTAIGLAASLACWLLASLLRRLDKFNRIQKRQLQSECGEVQVTYEYPRKIGSGDCETITVTLRNHSQRNWPKPMIYFAELARQTSLYNKNDTLPILTMGLPPLQPGEQTSTDIQFLGTGRRLRTKFWVVVENTVGGDQVPTVLEFELCMDVQRAPNDPMRNGDQAR